MPLKKKKPEQNTKSKVPHSGNSKKTGNAKQGKGESNWIVVGHAVAVVAIGRGRKLFNVFTLFQ